jgi:DNA-binding NtrC family response regulator
MSKGVVLVTRRRELVHELFQRLTSDAQLIACDDAAQLDTLAQDRGLTALLVHLDDEPAAGQAEPAPTADFHNLPHSLLKGPHLPRRLPEDAAEHLGPELPNEERRRPTLEACVDELERRVIEDSLQRHNQRRKETAAELGISRVTLYNKMKKLGLQ